MSGDDRNSRCCPRKGQTEDWAVGLGYSFFFLLHLTLFFLHVFFFHMSWSLGKALVSGVKQHMRALTQLPNPLFLSDISFNIKQSPDSHHNCNHHVTFAQFFPLHPSVCCWWASHHLYALNWTYSTFHNLKLCDDFMWMSAIKEIDFSEFIILYNLYWHSFCSFSHYKNPANLCKHGGAHSSAYSI